MSYQMYRATGKSRLIVDDAPHQSPGLSNVSSPAAQMIMGKQNHPGRPVENFDGRTYAAVGKTTGNTMIQTTLSFDTRQHQN